MCDVVLVNCFNVAITALTMQQVACDDDVGNNDYDDNDDDFKDNSNTNI